MNSLSASLRYLKFGRVTGFYAGLLVFFIASLYYVTFSWLVNLWWTDRSSAHGFLVPLISAYIVWVKREQIQFLEPLPSYLAGSIFTVVAALLLVAGRIGAFIHAETISLLLLLPGIILLVLGWDYIKSFWFPLFFLQFMIPWTEPLVEKIYFPFQLLTAWLASSLLDFLGYSVFRSGIFIQLPGFTMEVAPACSGINFLVSVVAIGLPLVYVSQKSWQRGFMVLSVGIGAMFIANCFRVTAAGLMGIYYGVDYLHGPGHFLRGWFVAQTSWLVLFLVNWRVSSIPCASSYTLVNRWRGHCAVSPAAPDAGKSVFPTFIGVLIFLACLGAYLNFFAMPESRQLTDSLETFPEDIGELRGTNSDWIDGGNYFPGADEELVRVYRSKEGKELFLYIGYFAVQRQGKALITFHNKPLHKNAGQVTVEEGGKQAEMLNVSSITQGKIAYNIYFWYQFPEKRLTNRLDAKLNAIYDALKYRRNAGAVILLAVRKSEGNYQAGMKEISGFSHAISEEFKIFLKAR